MRKTNPTSRRRSLFPISHDEREESDLACALRPNEEEEDDGVAILTNQSFTLHDYLIIGTIDKKRQAKVASDDENDAVNGSGTPLKASSPLSSALLQEQMELKTPNDSSSSNGTALPKLARKSLLLDMCGGSHAENLKRKSRPSPEKESPEGKFPKLDHDKSLSSSRVRTTLFPDDPIPARKFYSHSESNCNRRENNTSRPHSGEARRISPWRRKKSASSNLSYLCGKRRRGQGRNNGQINAGVRHRIKKSHFKRKLKVAPDVEQRRLLSDQVPETENETGGNEKSRPKSPPLFVIRRQFSRDEKCDGGDDKEMKNRKFFKSSRPRALTLNMTNNREHFKIQLQTPEQAARKRPIKSLTLDCSDLTAEEDEQDHKLMKNVSDILGALEEGKNSNKENEAVVEGNQPKASLILSPISQMCSTTSELAINSPPAKKLRLTSSEHGEKRESFERNGGLFPMFYGPARLSTGCKKPIKAAIAKQWKSSSLAEDQMLLDAGQKRFGATECPQCSLIYHAGDPADEYEHRNYHEARSTLRFHGWRNERIVAERPDRGARILKIAPGDPKAWWRKVAELQDVVIGEELGSYRHLNSHDVQAYLYIKNRLIVGCLTANARKAAHRLLSKEDPEAIDRCSEETFPIKCGVQRIWVAEGFRRQGIAEALMNCLRKNFAYGYVLNLDDVAVSSPTELGKLFAERYFKTPNFLVYV